MSASRLALNIEVMSASIFVLTRFRKTWMTVPLSLQIGVAIRSTFRTPASIRSAAAGRSPRFVAHFCSSKRTLPPEVLDRLVAHDDRGVAERCAVRPDLAPRHIETLAGRSGRVPSDLVRNQAAHGELRRPAPTLRGGIVAAFLRAATLRDDDIEEIHSHPDRRVCLAAGNHPDVTPEMLDCLVAGSNREARRLIASHNRIGIETLVRLATDPDEIVRRRALSNSKAIDGMRALAWVAV